MSPATQEQIGAAEAYEELLVPALLRQWAPRVADAAGIRPGQRVLDVACGTGILAREAASRVGPTGRVTGIDASPGMIAVARRLGPAIEWRDGIAEALPYPDQAFDAVVSQFGLMFFTDRRQALAEMQRVLVPGGRLAVAVWGALEDIPAYATLVKLVDEMAGRQAADALRAPFVLGSRQELAALCSSAGLRSAAIATHRGTGDFPSIRAMVEADVRGWLRLLGILLSEEQIADILRAAETALGAFATPAGRAVFDMSAHIVTASRE